MVAVVYEPWGDRTDPSASQDAIVTHLRQQAANVEAAVSIVFVPPPIDGLGNAGGFQMQVQDRRGVGLPQ
jgi:HAE1 family hydrophobic/amphiphilic exporter-1